MVTVNKYFFALFVFLGWLVMVANAQHRSVEKDSLSGHTQISNPVQDSLQILSHRTDSIQKLQISKKGPLPTSLVRHPVSFDLIFYIFLGLLLFLAFMKAAYGKYFNNLTRVFFNTSLKQSQLTDQLLQAKLPSLLMNIFFVVMAGMYIFLLTVINKKSTFQQYQYLGYAILFVVLAYVVKYFIVNIAGWLTGFSREAGGYIFIVFLINKIMSLALLPLVAIMTFSDPLFQKIAMVLSFILIVLLFIIRYYRSFGLLKNKINLSMFHFMLFVIGVELLPMLIIYKWAMNILTKSL